MCGGGGRDTNHVRIEECLYEPAVGSHLAEPDGCLREGLLHSLVTEPLYIIADTRPAVLGVLAAEANFARARPANEGCVHGLVPFGSRVRPHPEDLGVPHAQP